MDMCASPRSAFCSPRQRIRRPSAAPRGRLLPNGNRRPKARSPKTQTNCLGAAATQTVVSKPGPGAGRAKCVRLARKPRVAALPTPRAFPPGTLPLGANSTRSPTRTPLSTWEPALGTPKLHDTRVADPQFPSLQFGQFKYHTVESSNTVTVVLVAI